MHLEKDPKNNPENRPHPDEATEFDLENNWLNAYALSLEDETWRKIVKALAARGYPLKDEDLQAGRR